MKMENNSPDIDFIELFLFLKKKIVSIILFVVFSLILSSIFLLINKNKINIKYELNMIANSPSMIINCGSDFYCKANIIQSIINNKSKSITSNIDERGKKIILSWAGDDRYKPLITAEVNAIHKAIDDWYIQDYKTYKSIVNNQDSNYINGTETYAKVALLTKINTAGEKNFISINDEIVNKKYKPALIMALTLIIAVIFSSSYHIIKRSILEYKNKLNRSFY
nr:GNVR domain-containing protein [Escherichia coli]